MNYLLIFFCHTRIGVHDSNLVLDSVHMELGNGSGVHIWFLQVLVDSRTYMWIPALIISERRQIAIDVGEREEWHNTHPMPTIRLVAVFGGELLLTTPNFEIYPWIRSLHLLVFLINLCWWSWIANIFSNQREELTNTWSWL